MKTTEINEYQKQAQDFLTKLGIEFKCEYLRNGKHFADDKETRDIYKLTLIRGNRARSFEFGQSTAKSGLKIVNSNNGKVMREFGFDDKKWMKDGNFQRTSFMRLSGWQFAGCDEIKTPEAPTEYDLLACLTKYDVGTFEDFCGEFGYDTDSRKAEETYSAIKEEYEKVCGLFTDEELTELQEIN